MPPGQTQQHIFDMVCLPQVVIEVCSGHCDCLFGCAVAFSSPCLLRQIMVKVGSLEAYDRAPHLVAMASWVALSVQACCVGM
jgi:hypothetical protein